MNSWILSIIGVVFLGVFFDLLYPNGKTNALCKGLFGLAVLIVLINPIIKIKGDLFRDNLISSDAIESMANMRCDNIKMQIDSMLASKGIEGVDVEIDYKMKDYIFEIENIFVDVSNIVLTKNFENINKYEVITGEINNITSVDKSRIIIYGN